MVGDTRATVVQAEPGLGADAARLHCKEATEAEQQAWPGELGGSNDSRLSTQQATEGPTGSWVSHSGAVHNLGSIQLSVGSLYHFLLLKISSETVCAN